MLAVTIHDTRVMHGGEVLAFDLIDILRLLDPATKGSSWTCKNVECTGNLCEDLHDASDSGEVLSNPRLIQIAQGVLQVIDGDFEATRFGENRPWLAIRAIDSTLFVVICIEEGVIQKIREHFKEVRDSPEDAEYF
jgi:hypothetical protein